ncbi:hypothetical protein [Kaistella sp.]|uniref:hypothetical protein n=1 Tax=Kaistella sp. TaxID=2782235 RepID=UPI002F929C70
MDEILQKLYELRSHIEYIENDEKPNQEILYDVRSKLRLYISKFFNDRQEFEGLISEIDGNPKNRAEYDSTLYRLKSLINTLIEDLEISVRNHNLEIEKETQNILSKVRKEAEIERLKLQAEAEEIQKIKTELTNEKNRLLEEEEKYNLFKQKLEVADKNVDLLAQSSVSKNTAIFWAICALIISLILFYLINLNIDDYKSFSKISLETKKIFGKDFLPNNEILNKTILFSFIKFVLTKLMFYSILIYLLTFCVKNYNAQMHNFVINLHKANAFRSALSLIDTAKSDEGNDKLLIQTTQAIFSHQETGYNKNDPDSGNPNIITNVVESISKKI